MENEKSVYDQIIDLYTELVSSKHPTAVSGWPILTGHDIKHGIFNGWNIIVFEHTGNPAMKSTHGIGDISSTIIGYSQITDDNKTNVRERISKHFRLSRSDALFIFDQRDDIQQDLNAVLLQHEMEMGL